MNRVAARAVGVCLMVGACVLLWNLRGLVAVFTAAVVVAAAARPVVDALITKRIPRGLALAGTYVGAAGLVVTFGVLVGGAAAGEAQAAAGWVSDRYQALILSWGHAGFVRSAIAQALPAPRAILKAATQMKPAAVAEVALTATGFVLQALGTLVITIVLSLYWTVHRKRVTQLVLSLIPATHKPWVRRLFGDIETGVGFLLLAEGLKTVAVTTTLALAFRAMHLPFPTIAAALIGLVRVVPLAGMAVSMLIAAMGASVLGSVAAVTAGLITLLVLVLTERLLARALASRDYNPVLTVATVLALSTVYGWVGLLLAAPAAAAVQIALETLFSSLRDKASVATDNVGDLLAQAKRIRGQLGALSRPSARAVAILERDEALLIEAQKLIEATETESDLSAA